MAYTDIDKPEDYFNTKLYTGNGSTQSITGVGFQPDLVWVKRRNSIASNQVIDVIRTPFNRLQTNENSAEAVDSSPYNYFKTFDSDGFTMGTGAEINGNSDTFASWNWLASNTTASNTDGSITSTVSANTTSGFSIVSYTGTGSVATVGHSLGTTPSMIIFKNRTVARNWISYHDSIGATKFMYFNLTNAETTDSTAFNNTAPTSSVFSLGSNVGGNESGSSMIAYCFAEKKGFSKFGSFVANGTTDNSFIYTGMKPAWVMVKRTNSSESWHIFDNKRDINENNIRLQANSNGADDSSEAGLDMLSNGFKVRTSWGGIGGSGDSYIYMAFAENPFVTSTSIPCTAR